MAVEETDSPCGDAADVRSLISYAPWEKVRKLEENRLSSAMYKR